MQPLTVGVSFFWIMLFVAFAVGFIAARYVTREERRDAVDQAKAAAELMAHIAATLRVTRTPLPIALHRRICDFRARVGA